MMAELLVLTCIASDHCFLLVQRCHGWLDRSLDGCLVCGDRDPGKVDGWLPGLLLGWLDSILDSCPMARELAG